jgi:hypothetical protein
MIKGAMRGEFDILYFVPFMENVIRIDLTDSLNSDDIENSKQVELTENVQDQCSAGDHSKSLENVILKNNADITQQNVFFFHYI